MNEREMIRRALTLYAADLCKKARSRTYAGPSFTQVRASMRARAYEYERLAVRYEGENYAAEG